MRISRRDQAAPIKKSGPVKGQSGGKEAAGSGGSGGAQGSDGVSISAKASEVQQAKAALENVPDVRVEKVEAIQNEIESGTYQRDSKQVAKRIVNEHLRQSSKKS